MWCVGGAGLGFRSFEATGRDLHMGLWVQQGIVDIHGCWYCSRDDGVGGSDGSTRVCGLERYYKGPWELDPQALPHMSQDQAEDSPSFCPPYLPGCTVMLQPWEPRGGTQMPWRLLGCPGGRGQSDKLFHKDHAQHSDQAGHVPVAVKPHLRQTRELSWTGCAARRQASLATHRLRAGWSLASV